MTAVLPGREERASSSVDNARRTGRGVVIVGGAHGTLGFARSLRGRNIPVWQITDENPLAAFSRDIKRSLRWGGAEQEDAADTLIGLAKTHGLEGFLLLPAGDPEVKLVSQNYDRLSAVFRLATRPWDELSWACDKAKAYRRGRELGLGIPEIYNIASATEAAAADILYPVVLKPSMRIARNPFTIAKAWRADDRETFLSLYDRAARYVGAENVVIQELVPGGGETQLSYTALWHEGEPVAEFIARRSRQSWRRRTYRRPDAVSCHRLRITA
jgi:predicted ATP-grasp superfamily ATP-dependent carboligase